MTDTGSAGAISTSDRYLFDNVTIDLAANPVDAVFRVLTISGSPASLEFNPANQRIRARLMPINNPRITFRITLLKDGTATSANPDGVPVAPGVRPRLAVVTSDMKSGYRAGEAVSFRASTNYPAWIDRAEIRILDRDRSSRGLAVVPVAPNGTAGWTMPAVGADEMLFALRVYDAGGRFDETHHQALNRTAANFPAVALDGPIIAPGEDLDMPARRGIAVRGGSVTVTGSATPGGTVPVMGEAAQADATGRFVLQRILPPGAHEVRVGDGAAATTRSVTTMRRPRANSI
ncbi:hypothetical protein CCR83_12440 [Rhodobacter veldkampii DSM 11550]|uniref:Uncharacterized protein n=1 Tax=Phaeovulum veldkampii DSM 11550 TaxID=1185920 RepID=A0A2T4JJQ2_9RHOB|nr:hypothetical protein [Phaeovulum veldkampii]MBK5947226.1 hypothetical protein [Phaeovulum veldkampii DSM 11550]PTE18007.1 hypothetical protein C5F46_06415 [Phaeovulum veldkampii DSM 11550]TDQ60085.1 hypothetical protein EV658_10635 [Phaeovulum veldkampii DSM 11550]